MQFFWQRHGGGCNPLHGRNVSTTATSVSTSCHVWHWPPSHASCTRVLSCRPCLPVGVQGNSLTPIVLQPPNPRRQSEMERTSSIELEPRTLTYAELQNARVTCSSFFFRRDLCGTCDPLVGCWCIFVPSFLDVSGGSNVDTEQQVFRRSHQDLHRGKKTRRFEIIMLYRSNSSGFSC